jgi:hypothetical protein
LCRSNGPPHSLSILRVGEGATQRRRSPGLTERSAESSCVVRRAHASGRAGGASRQDVRQHSPRRRAQGERGGRLPTAPLLRLERDLGGAASITAGRLDSGSPRLPLGSPRRRRLPGLP